MRNKVTLLLNTTKYAVGLKTKIVIKAITMVDLVTKNIDAYMISIPILS